VPAFEPSSRRRQQQVLRRHKADEEQDAENKMLSNDANEDCKILREGPHKKCASSTTLLHSRRGRMPTAPSSRPFVAEAHEAHNQGLGGALTSMLYL